MTPLLLQLLPSALLTVTVATHQAITVSGPWLTLILQQVSRGSNSALLMSPNNEPKPAKLLTAISHKAKLMSNPTTRHFESFGTNAVMCCRWRPYRWFQSHSWRDPLNWRRMIHAMSKSQWFSLQTNSADLITTDSPVWYLWSCSTGT